MKKIILSIALIAIVSTTFAKKVKFSVNMTGNIINPTGIHVAGDFQVAAGYAFDWDSGITPMVQETADTNIYSVVVDVPAFHNYEYRFFNGDQGYEAEFVPVVSRVLYNFDDNRWLYIDSTSSDTTFIGAIPFAGTAPSGQRLLRFRVDMQYELLNSSGAHVGGDYQSLLIPPNYLYSFDGLVYEYIAYVDTAVSNYSYRFINGSSFSDLETIIGACADGAGNRNVIVTQDTMLDIVCFAHCVDCSLLVNVDENNSTSTINLFPNPTSDFTLINFNDNAVHTVNILDLTGRLVRSYSNAIRELKIEKQNLASGIYNVKVTDNKNNFTNSKLIIE